VNKLLSMVAVLICGGLFGIGLSVSTMIQPEIILSFLTFSDFGLLLVLGGATTVTLLIYQLGPKLLKTPLFADKFSVRPEAPVKRTLIGSALFGIGWGLCGVCPGPAIAGLGAGNWPLVLALLGMFAGGYVQGKWFSGDSQGA